MKIALVLIYLSLACGIFKLLSHYYQVWFKKIVRPIDTYVGILLLITSKVWDIAYHLETHRRVDITFDIHNVPFLKIIGYMLLLFMTHIVSFIGAITVFGVGIVLPFIFFRESIAKYIRTELPEQDHFDLYIIHSLFASILIGGMVVFTIVYTP